MILGPCLDGEWKTMCQTCTRTHKAGYVCLSKKCKRCFDWGEKGHFKVAPLCKKPIVKKPSKTDKKALDKKKYPCVIDRETDDMDSDLNFSCGTVVETVGNTQVFHT